MQVRCKTLKPTYWFWISVRPYRDVMRAVPHINSRGVRMNYLQAWVLRLQSSRPFFSLLPVSPQPLACVVIRPEAGSSGTAQNSSGVGMYSGSIPWGIPISFEGKKIA
jgi:hypothetical protein